MEPQPQRYVPDPYDDPLPMSDELRLTELSEARERLNTLVEKMQRDLASVGGQRDGDLPAKT